MAYVPSYSSLPASYPSFDRTPGRVVRTVPKAAKGSAYGGFGKPVVAAATAIAGNTSSVRALQMFLNNRGYHITVDGNRGPQTNAAVAAYHSGLSPAKFNTSGHATGGRVTRTPVAVTRGPGGAHMGGAAPVVTRTKGRVTVAPVGAAPAAATAATPAAAAGMTDEQTVDAMMEAQYGPQIAALQRAAAQAQAQGQANAAYLGRAYGEVAGTAGQAAGLTQAANTQLLAGADTANTNMANLFGGPGANGPAGEAAAFSDINRGELSQLASSQQAFDANMTPVIQTQGANAQASALADAQAQMADYLSQIQGITAERGATRTSTLAQLQQQSLQNQKDQQALDLAKAMYQPTVEKARAEAVLAGNKAANFGNEFKLKLHQAGMSDKRTNAYITNMVSRTNAMTKKMALDAKKGTIDYTDPNTIGTMGKNLGSLIFNKNGGFNVHPGVARSTLVASLNSMFPKGVPPSLQPLVGNLIEQGLARAHNNGLWKGVVYNPKTGGITDRTPRKPKGKK